MGVSDAGMGPRGRVGSCRRERFSSTKNRVRGEGWGWGQGRPGLKSCPVAESRGGVGSLRGWKGVTAWVHVWPRGYGDPCPGVPMGTGVCVVKAWHWVRPPGLGHGWTPNSAPRRCSGHRCESESGTLGPRVSHGRVHCREQGEAFTLKPSFSQSDPLPLLDHRSFLPCQTNGYTGHGPGSDVHFVGPGAEGKMWPLV